MSDIRCRVALTQNMAAATDPGSKRYAMGSLLVTPADSGEVFVTATDGRILAVCRQKGETDGVHLLPGDMAKLTKTRPTVKAELNGRWEAQHGKKLAVDDEPVGRFPKMADCIPEAEPDCLVVALDADLLAKLAQAVAADGRCVTLMIANPATTAKYAEKPIQVLGSAGIGVIMPLKPGINERAAFNAARDDYAKATAGLTLAVEA